MPNKQKNRKSTPQTSGQNPSEANSPPSGEHGERADEPSQAANTGLQHKLAVVELHRNLLIETLRGLTGDPWPPSPWRGEAPPKRGITEDPGDSWPTSPWRGETLPGQRNTEDLKQALVEAEQHRHLLIETLHGVSKQIVVARL